MLGDAIASKKETMHCIFENFKNCNGLFGFRDREDHFLNLRLSSGLLKLIHVLSGGVVQIKQVFSRNFISDCNCIPPLPLF